MSKPADKFIGDSASWLDFFSAATELPPSSRPDKPSKGKVFERLTQLYLQTHPEYQTKLKNVWPITELPREVGIHLELPKHDEGIDLVAETYEGEYWAIQCKFKSDTREALTVSDLATFTNLTFNVCKKFRLALVVHTCAKPVKKNKLLGNTVEIGLDRWLQLSDDDWQRIRLATSGKSKPPIKREPRDHQKQAIAAAQKHFVAGKAGRGRLIMPCGTGKSLTAFWIAEALEAKTILVAVPSLYLIKAGIEDWTRESVARGERPEWLVVCSDETTGKVEQDEFVGQVYDLGIDATTDTERIKKFLKKRTNGRKVVFCTYQSGKVLAEAAQLANTSFDLGIFDEAHRTVGNPDKAFSHLVSDSNIKIKRRMFMTATERVARGVKDDVLSMDDAQTYGDRFYQLTFKEAIHSDPPIICDYKIITIAVSDLEVRGLIEENRYLTTDAQSAEREAITLAAGIALQRMFDEKGVTHAITFHRSIKAAEDFKEQHEKLIKAKKKRNKPACFHVSSKKTTGERAGLIQDYRNEAKAIMTNARCLQEGVDIPAVDCVMFADPKQSVVDIVQAAGRAMRPAPGKTFGYIALPIVVPSGMDFEQFAETTEFRQVARVVTALSTQDERIVEEFRTVESKPRGTGKIVEINGALPTGTKIDFSQFSEQIRLKLWERVGKANWKQFEEAREIVHTLGIKNELDWRKNKATIPADIPKSPEGTYSRSGDWTNWPDWLGTKTTPRNIDWRNFIDARDFARSLQLRSEKEWRKFSSSGNFGKLSIPFDIPSNPQLTYQKTGEWISWPDWLGTSTLTKKDKRVSYNDARRFVCKLKLGSETAWRKYCRGELPDLPLKPKNIPTDARSFYGKTKEWISWGDFLGTGHRRGSHRSYNEARTFVHSLSLQTQTEWFKYVRGEIKDKPSLPDDIAKSPSATYAKRGWINWADWLGTRDIRSHRRFELARVYARSLGLKSIKQWNLASENGLIPNDIPKAPHYVYRNSGWISWADWLGKVQD